MSRRLFCLFVIGLSFCQLSQVQAVVIPQVPGIAGNSTNFSAPGTVTVGEDGTADFLVDFDPMLISVPDSSNPFVYTTTLTWLQPVDTSGVVVTEVVRGANGEEGNLAAFGIMPAITGTGATSGASFPAIPFNIMSYEAKVTGLQPGDTASFVKVGSGGRVLVPEPATLVPAILGMLGSLALRRRIA
ncbi:MAG: hypothetical protein KDA92_16030 [Planctomycetales bacterium]|nr:hypothetical protein [Planctomycetales bacterium]MCA9166818.1 hypothetical protein [Planctomycetales bacterium]